MTCNFKIHAGVGQACLVDLPFGKRMQKEWSYFAQMSGISVVDLGRRQTPISRILSF